MPEVMEAEVFDLGVFYGRRDGLLGPPEVALSLAVREDERRPVQRTGEAPDDAPHGGGQRDVPGLAVLRARDGEHPGLKVHVLPPQAKELALAATGALVSKTEVSSPGELHLYRGTGAPFAAEIASQRLSDIPSRCFTVRLGLTCNHGRAEQRVAARPTVLGLAFAAHPARPRRAAPPSGVPHRSLEQSAHDPSACADITGDLSCRLPTRRPSPRLSSAAAPWEARRD
jgi:hypothetical protein